MLPLGDLTEFNLQKLPSMLAIFSAFYKNIPLVYPDFTLQLISLQHACRLTQGRPSRVKIFRTPYSICICTVYLDIQKTICHSQEQRQNQLSELTDGFGQICVRNVKKIFHIQHLAKDRCPDNVYCQYNIDWQIECHKKHFLKVTIRSHYVHKMKT